MAAAPHVKSYGYRSAHLMMHDISNLRVDGRHERVPVSGFAYAGQEEEPRATHGDRLTETRQLKIGKTLPVPLNLDFCFMLDGLTRSRNPQHYLDGPNLPFLKSSG